MKIFDRTTTQPNQNHFFLIAFAGVLALWLVLQWTYARPPALVADWIGWRQADTQAIALNFRDSGNNLFYPQIDWRGTGVGYVETELQLYTYLVSLLMPAEGRPEWPGQAISLTAMALTVLLLYLRLSTLFSPPAGLLAALFMLGSLGILQLSVAVQPDALCFFLYCCHLLSFHRFLTDGENRWLWTSTALAVLAALVKPPALHLGIIQFVAVVLIAPHYLRQVRLWVNWGVILGIFALYMVHAHQLYLQTGHTFGIGFDGDSKWPGLQELLSPWNYYRLLRQSQVWGIGTIGLVSALYLLWKKRLSGWEIALMAGNAAHLIVAMRYTTFAWFGSHYHVFTIFLGAWLFAHAAQVFIAGYQGPTKLLRLAGVAAVCLLATRLGVNVHQRVYHGALVDGQTYLELAARAKPFLTPNDLLVARSSAPTRVIGWSRGRNNYEDPRLFYLTGTKGWVVAMDDDRPEHLQRFMEQGAKLYIHVGPPLSKLPRTEQWLRENGTLLATTLQGAIFQLHLPMPGSGRATEIKSVIPVQ